MNYTDSLNEGIAAVDPWNDIVVRGPKCGVVSILEDLKLDPIQEDEPLLDEKKHCVPILSEGKERRSRNQAWSDYDFKTQMEELLATPVPHPLERPPRIPTKEALLSSHRQQRRRTTDVITCAEDFDRMVQTATKRRRHRNQAFSADDFEEFILPNLESSKPLVFV